MDTLPKGVLHNDANDHNVIVSQDGSEVVGVLDFGDMVYSCYIFELAITIAYGSYDIDVVRRTQ